MLMFLKFFVFLTISVMHDWNALSLSSKFIIFNFLLSHHLKFDKGHRSFADLRYGKEDSISPTTLIFAVTKGLLGIYTLYIPLEVL